MDAIDVLCIGQSSVDIFCDTLERVPKPGEFCLIDYISMFPGGCPTNTALVTARLKLKTGLITAIGGDNLGKFILGELRGAGIITDGVTLLEGACSGKCVILLVKGDDRRLIFQKGANELFCREHIDFSYIDKSRIILLSSYPSGIPKLKREDVIALFRLAKEKGKTVIMDVLIDYQKEKSLEALFGIMEHTDYFIMNRDEGERLTGKTDHREQCEELLEIGARNVIVKLGPEGSYVQGKDLQFRAHPYRVTVKDPTGAGDSFNGGLIYGLFHGWELKKCLLFANIVGASAVTELGCTSGVYDLQRLESILPEFEKEYGDD